MPLTCQRVCRAGAGGKAFRHGLSLALPLGSRAELLRLGAALDLPPARPLFLHCPRFCNVRYGSLADIYSAKRHVRLTPNGDCKSGLPQTAMPALPLKADMCSALTHVCFGPIADISQVYSITSSARASSDGGTVEAERLGGLEIDHQLVLGRRLHRKVGRLLALEDAIDVARRSPVLVDGSGP